MELVILLVAFAEQAVSAFSGGGARHFIAPSVILAFSLGLLWLRTRRAFIFPRWRLAR